jgi:hypothetical protein
MVVMPGDEEHQMRDHEQEPSGPTQGSSPCGSYGRGHDVHHIPAIRSSNVEHRQGNLALVSGNLIIIDFGTGDFRSYCNHHPQRILSIIKIGGTVRVPEGYSSILRGGGGHCFSILPAEEEWVPCDQDRPIQTRFRPPRKGAAGNCASAIPELSPVTLPILRAIRERLPRSDDDASARLAFSIAHDVLQAVHVEDRLWMATIWRVPFALQVEDATLADEIHLTIREWLGHFQDPACRELAEHIAFEVLGARHVLDELWSLHVSVDWELDQ